MHGVEINSQDYQIQLSPIREKLQNIKDLTANNIEKVLVRGEKLDRLVNTSEKLNENSNLFYKSSRKLKNILCYKRLRCYILSSCMFGLLIYLLSWGICGKTNLHNCN